MGRFKSRKASVVVGSLVAMASAALLAGCGGGGSSSGGAGGQSAGKSIHLGVVASLTGPAGPFGKFEVHGIELAAANWNAKHKSRVAISIQDDQGEPKSGVSALHKLIEESPDAIVGPLPSTVGVALAPIVNSAQIPMMSPSVSAPEFVSRGGYTFRNHLTVAKQIGATTEWAFEHGTKRFGMLMPNAADGKSGAKQVEVVLKKAGGTITGTEFVEPTQTEFESQITKLVAGNPEALWVFVISPQGIALAMKEARQLGYKGRFLTISNVESEEFTKAAGDAGEGAVWSVETQPKSAAYEAFVAEFKKKYGEGPEYIAANSYDATMMLAEGVAAVGGGSALRKWLHEQKYQGVSGPISFDEEGNVVERPLVIRELSRGTPVKVGGE